MEIKTASRNLIPGSSRVARSERPSETRSEKPAKPQVQRAGAAAPKDQVSRSQESRQAEGNRAEKLASAFADAFGGFDGSDSKSSGADGSRALDKDRKDDVKKGDRAQAKPGKSREPGELKVPGHPKTPGQPQAPTEKEIQQAIEKAGDEDSLDALNSVDSFRESLPPEQQEKFDEQLRELREDERIEFELDSRLDDEKYLKSLTPEERAYAESLKDNPEAYEDLFLRGFVASTFGNPDRRDEAIDKATQRRGLESTEGAGDHEAVDGKFEVRLGVENLKYKNSDGTDVEALAYANGGAISANVAATVRTLSTPGDQGIPAHEFEHILNNERREGEAVSVPDDVSIENSQRLLELYQQANPGKEVDHGHVYTDVLNDFLANPQQLHKESPELYALAAEIQGYDPVEGNYPQPSLVEKVGDFLKDLFS